MLTKLAAALVVAWLALPSAAPAAADPPDPGKAQSFTYGSGALANPYLLYTPTSYQPHRPAPLVVMAHGCQTTAEEQMRANRYNSIAEREGFLVLYPDIDVTGTLQPGPTVRCWRFFDPQDWHRDQADAAAIAGMTRQVMSRWNVDPERVYMMGMSAGAFMTSVMAAAYPDLYAAVGLNAGGAYGDPGCLLNPVTWRAVPASPLAQLAFNEMGPRARVVPILELHGDADTGVDVHCGAKAVEQALRTDNLAIDGVQDAPLSLTPASVQQRQKPGGYSYAVETYRDPGGCEIAERWIVHGMDHFWSGGSSDPQWARWTDPKGPSAAEASWRFFSRYRKSQTDMPCAEAPPQAAGKVLGKRTCGAAHLTIRMPLRRGEALSRVRAYAARRRTRATIHGDRVVVTLPRGHAQKASVVVRAHTTRDRKLRIVRTLRGCGAAR